MNPILKNTLSPLLPHFVFALESCICPSPVTQRDVQHGSLHVLSAAPSSGGKLLTLFPCSPMGSLPGSQSTMNFSTGSPSHRLLCVLLQLGSPLSLKFSQQSCSSMGSSPGAHSSCQEPGALWAFCRVTASFGHPHQSVGLLPQVTAAPQSSMGCRDTSASPRPAPQAAGNLSSSTWSTSFYSFFTDLGVCSFWSCF